VNKRIIFNNPNLKLRRQKLRLDSSNSEKVLWQKIRHNKLGHKFLRQYSVEGYVLDFYCPEKRMAIEIDGGYHSNQDARVYDSYRTRYIEAFNIKVMRFWNSDIGHHLNEVLRDIKEIVASPS